MLRYRSSLLEKEEELLFVKTVSTVLPTVKTDSLLAKNRIHLFCCHLGLKELFWTDLPCNLEMKQVVPVRL